MTGPSKNPQPRAKLLEVPADLQEKCRANLAEHSRREESGCIVWTAARSRGYGVARLRLDGRYLSPQAHRLAWLIERGPITDPNLVLDHLCRNRACLNVEHLELVTAEENSRRGDSWQRRDRPAEEIPQTSRTSCTNGHAWPEHAAYQIRSDGHRYLVCLECKRDVYRRWYAKQRKMAPGSGIAPPAATREDEPSGSQ